MKIIHLIQSFTILVVLIANALPCNAHNIADVARQFQNKQIDVDSLFNYMTDKNHSGEVYWWALHNSEKNDPLANYVLGRCYLLGIGTTKDESQAKTSFEKAVSQGIDEALVDLGRIYLYGWGVDKNEAKATQYIKQALEKNIPRGIYMQGNIYLDKQDYKKAYNLFNQAASAGLASALCNLGYLYEMGYGVDKDFSNAMKYYMASAQKGNKQGLYNVGVMYEYGKGVAENFSEAYKYYYASAQKGHSMSQYKVAYFNQNGYVENAMSFDQIVHWYELSTNQGCNYAKLELALLYFDGEHIPQDITKAIEMIESTDIDFIWGLPAIKLADYYEKTKPSKALYWAKIAYDNSPIGDEDIHPWACYLLGNLYLKGGKEIYDYQSAVKYLKEGLAGYHWGCAKMLEALGEPFVKPEGNVQSETKINCN